MQDLKARMVALEAEVSRFTRMKVRSAEAGKDEVIVAESEETRG